MSVLNKYNQRVIAILGTITIVALAAVIIISSFFMIEEFIDLRSHEPFESGLTLETEQKGDSILRDQAISLKMPIRIDSARQLYVIPVGQSNLEFPYHILGILNTTEAFPEMIGHHDLNNLLVYDVKTNQSTPLFDQKTSIDDFDIFSVNEAPFIIISASQKDSDKNGRLNNEDLLSLFIYDVLAKKMHQFEDPCRGLIRTSKLYSTPNLVAQFGIDKNGNGSIERSGEPHVQIIINLLDFSSKDMVSELIRDELQRIID